MSAIIRATSTIYGLDADLAALATADAAEQLRATTAETALQTALDAEAARAIAAETANTAADAAEHTARVAAETALQTNIDAEATLARTNETTLQTNITAEATARAAAITAEAEARTAADTLLSNRINALGSAFNYVGTLAGGADSANALDLAALTTGTKDAGDYYKVSTPGYFKVGSGATFFGNAGDGLVWNLVGTIDKIDNTNSEVQGTANYITVTGSTDSGFTVDVNSTFKGRVTTLESDLVSEISRAETAEAAITTDLTAETTRATAAETAIVAAADAEHTARLADEATQTAALQAYATEAARLGGSHNIVEFLTVTNDRIVLTNSPKSGVFGIVNYMTARYTNSSTNEAFDYPVTKDVADTSGKTFILAVAASGDLNNKTVAGDRKSVV